MKKIVIFGVILCVMFTSCVNEKSLNKDIAGLKATKESLIADCNTASKDLYEMSVTKNLLEEDLKVLNIYTSSGTPRYVLKLRLKQSRISLDLGEHVKDAMNAIEFEMPVDKEFYDSVHEGTDIVDNFRAGSFVMSGTFGSWKMTVISKSIYRIN